MKDRHTGVVPGAGTPRGYPRPLSKTNERLEGRILRQVERVYTVLNERLVRRTTDSR